MLGDFLLIRDR